MSLFRRKPKGAYVGRLAFEPATGFHIDPAGNHVVTFDGGQTWRFAEQRDESHNVRYQKNAVVVKGTTGEDPHDASPTADDPHLAGLVFTTDDKRAAVETSHTEAGK